MQGEDVTHNALTGAIQGLPLSLAASKAGSSSSSNGDGGGSSVPAEVEVRGEVFMTTSDFEQVRGVHGLVCYYSVTYVLVIIVTAGVMTTLLPSVGSRVRITHCCLPS
jgi:hypothetical protein